MVILWWLVASTKKGIHVEDLQRGKYLSIAAFVNMGTFTPRVANRGRLL
jgi:hypothetical protein